MLRDKARNLFLNDLVDEIVKRIGVGSMSQTISEKFKRTEYPRPQFKREGWENLNGVWNFSFDDDNVGEAEKWFEQPEFSQTINVPFTYETVASGIHVEDFHPFVWYHRTFTVNEENKQGRALLRFQASDYFTKVWVNGQFVGEHRGGYASFYFDVSEALHKGENTIVVKVEDSNSMAQPRGKQRWVKDNFGCWYVQQTGIWQTVWLEYLGAESIDHVKITPNIDTSTVKLDYSFSSFPTSNWQVKTEISFEGQTIQSFSFTPTQQNHSVEVDVIKNDFEWQVHLWSPESPKLYDVTFELEIDGVEQDKIESYFGMRKVSISNGQVELNNEPIYQKLLLDQGYWTETMLTPPSDEAMLEDIDKTLEMGFNGVRKHQKLEDERFLYWCDKKGLLVWSEMAATYAFNDEAVDNFTREWLDVIKQHYNHPSIITWVPFNESWGVPKIKVDKKQQAFTESIYYLTKTIDDERPVIVNDGWEHTISDIIALHDYEELGKVFKDRYEDKESILGNKVSHNGFKYTFADGYEYKGQPVMITEYGGIAFDEGSGWGYGNQVNTEEEFIERYQKITEAIKEIPYISGYCYTQTTDVQQEINGLLNEDRSPKVALEKIKEINDSEPGKN